VLELVEGETLADRIARGPLPLDEALAIARQIADALEAAHEQGIVHRDLKPANVKVRPDGTVKVLDFGLAKAMERADAEAEISAGLLSLPTITSPAVTLRGVILGTAAYMSPEQARGKPVDRRTDIWAFGCVLFETLSGTRAFDGGETVSDAVAAILKNEPTWASLPPDTPPPLRALLRRCLQKDPQKRLPHIGVARLEIDELLSGAVETSPADVAAAAGARGTQWPRTALWLFGGVLLGAGALAVAGRYLTPAPSAPTPVRLTARLAEDVSLGLPFSGMMGATTIISPDGSTLAFVGQKGNEAPQLYVRRLDQLQATPLAGTDHALGPFFSPDGQWIGFFAGGKLKKVAVNGGATVTLADAPVTRGGTWTDDDRIIFAANPLAGLSRVSAAGGQVEPATELEQGEATHRWPHALPGGRGILFGAHTQRNDHDNGRIVVQPWPLGARKVLLDGGYDARYLESGHILYVREGTLFAVPFDLDRLETSGKPVPVLEGIGASNISGWAQFAVSGNGTLVYGANNYSTSAAQPIHWVDQQGRLAPLRATAADWATPSFSPDGRLLAMSIDDGQRRNVWVYDIARDSLTSLGAGASPTWTPDGKRLTISRIVGPTAHLFSVPADGSADAQQLTDGPRNHRPGSWHPSGRYLAYTALAGNGASADIMILEMDGASPSATMAARPATPFLNGPSAEYDPAFSPDGRWVAYVSDESGSPAVYVRPFPGSGPKWMVSSGNVSNSPQWSRTRRELLYAQSNQQSTVATLAPAMSIMVVPYSIVADEFRPEKARPWATGMLLPRFFVAPHYALHPDGQRVAMAPMPAADTSRPNDSMVFVFNFFDEVRRLTAGAR
jgi:serine/threonine-protein kinase